ncbi:hypothetical protein GCM10028796_32950 [Ramlibacter monticola]
MAAQRRAYYNEIRPRRLLRTSAPDQKQLPSDCQLNLLSGPRAQLGFRIDVLQHIRARAFSGPMQAPRVVLHTEPEIGTMAAPSIWLNFRALIRVLLVSIAVIPVPISPVVPAI